MEFARVAAHNAAAPKHHSAGHHSSDLVDISAGGKQQALTTARGLRGLTIYYPKLGLPKSSFSIPRITAGRMYVRLLRSSTDRPCSERASAKRAPTPLALSMIDIPPLPAAWGPASRTNPF